MNPPAGLSRRSFLLHTLAGAGALTIGARSAAAAAAEAKPLWGACKGADQLKALAAAGYDFVEAGVASLLMPNAPDAEFEAALKKLGTPAIPLRSCTSFFPPEMRLTGTGVKLDELAAYADRVFRRAKKAGVTRIVLGSGGARKIPAGFDPAKARDQFIELGKKLGPLAAAQEVIVVLEPLNRGETNFFNRVEEGVGLVDAIAHPNIQLLADIYHMLREDEGPESLVKAGARLRHCHIAEKKSRTAPGTEGDDFRPYFKALKQIGYQDGISVEGKWGKDPKTDLPHALKTMKDQWASA